LAKDNAVSEQLKYSTKNSNNSLEIMKAAMKEADENNK
jgi:DNA replication protein DnaD